MVLVAGLAATVWQGAAAPIAASHSPPRPQESRAPASNPQAPKPQRSSAPERVASIRVVPLGRPSVHVPILMYHYVGTIPPNDPFPQQRAGLTVRPEAFAQQLDWLGANGYHAVDLADLRDYVAGRNDLPSRPVILTFDDGTSDLFTTAYPKLLARGMKGVAFLVSGFLDAPGRVTRGQAVQMSTHGIEIGSHTVTHQDLTTLPPDRVDTEVQRSRQDLERLTGRPVLDFAYPSGRHNPAVDAAIARAGYESATTTALGTEHALGDRFAWTRVRVGGETTLDQFASSLGTPDPTEVRQQVVSPSSPPRSGR
jgi:peptidoglycan/xylan/chitin deacetylase (PgdA/CDA1 family)